MRRNFLKLLVYAQIPQKQKKKQKRKWYKLYEASEKCIFIGCSFQSKGYKLYSLKIKKMIISSDVLFDEDAMWSWEKEVVVKNVVLPIDLP